MRSFHAALFIAVLSLPVVGQAGNGGNADLDITPMAIGASITLSVSGGANQAYGVWMSDAPASIVTPHGVVSIDVGSAMFSQIMAGSLSPSGSAAAVASLPADPALLAVVAYIQGAVVDPGHPSGVAITRAIRVDFEPPDSFLSLPPVAIGRISSTGDLLRDGRVFVAGGSDAAHPVPVAGQSTEIFQPYSRSWSAGPTLGVPRVFHATAVLADGRVLLTGGLSTGDVVTTTCEIFDPATNTMTPAAPMSVARAGHGATALADGRVLVAGGTSYLAGISLAAIMSATLGSAEIWDPALDAWTPAGNAMASHRFLHTQTRLADGRVLCVAGFSGYLHIPILAWGDIPDFTATCDLFDPSTGSFTPAAPIPNARGGHRATLLSNGDVLVAGGLTPALFAHATGDARAYHPATGSWASIGTLTEAVSGQGQVLLRNGVCHVSGGATGYLQFPGATSGCNTLSPSFTTFAASAAMPAPRRLHLAIRLLDGSVLIAGGSDANGAETLTTLLYTPVP